MMCAIVQMGVVRWVSGRRRERGSLVQIMTGDACSRIDLQHCLQRAGRPAPFSRQRQQQEEGGGDGITKIQVFTTQVKSFLFLFEKTDQSLAKAVSGHVVFRDRLLAFGVKMRQYFLFGSQNREYIYLI